MNPRPTSVSRFFSLAILALAVWFSARVVWTDAEYLRQPAWIDDDARAQLLPVIAHRNPEAFQDRFVSSYGDRYLPIGYRGLMRALTARIEPVAATKGLGLILQVLTLTVALAAGWRLGGISGGAFTIALTARSIPFHDHVYAGLFRSFAIVLVLLMLWTLAERRYRLAGLVLLFQALFYPPVCLISLPVFGLTGLRGLRPLKGMPYRTWHWRPLMETAVYCGVAFGILLLYSRKPEGVGRAVNLREADAYDELFSQGRFSELPFPGVLPEFRRTFSSGVDVVNRGRVRLPALVQDPVPRANLLVATLLALAGVTVWTRPPGWGALAGFAASGCSLYLLSRSLAFQLGFPERFIAYNLPFAAVLLWAMAWRGSRGRRGFGLIVGLCGLILVFAPGWREPNTRRKVLDVTPNLELYRKIARTEPGALLTAWPPDILDEIPVFARRESLVDMENAHPLYPEYYARIRERMLHSLELAFTNDPGRAAWIRDQYGLTHLVVGNNIYDPSQGHPVVFAPYTQMGRRHRALALADPLPPIFRNPPPEWVFDRTGKQTIIDLTAIDTPPSFPPDPKPPATSWLAWGGGLRLVRIESLTEKHVPGGEMALRFHWNLPLHMLERNNVFFVHFLHGDRIHFTRDHPLFTSLDQAEIPAELFHPMDVAYDLRLRIPESAPSGEYLVRVGLLNRHGPSPRSRLPPDTDEPLPDNAWITPLRIHILPAHSPASANGFDGGRR